MCHMFWEINAFRIFTLRFVTDEISVWRTVPVTKPAIRSEYPTVLYPCYVIRFSLPLSEKWNINITIQNTGFVNVCVVWQITIFRPLPLVFSLIFYPPNILNLVDALWFANNIQQYRCVSRVHTTQFCLKLNSYIQSFLTYVFMKLQ